MYLGVEHLNIKGGLFILPGTIATVGVVFIVDICRRQGHCHFTAAAAYHHWEAMLVEPVARNISFRDFNTTFLYILCKALHV